MGKDSDRRRVLLKGTGMSGGKTDGQDWSQQGQQQQGQQQQGQQQQGQQQQANNNSQQGQQQQGQQQQANNNSQQGQQQQGQQQQANNNSQQGQQQQGQQQQGQQGQQSQGQGQAQGQGLSQGQGLGVGGNRLCDLTTDGPIAQEIQKCVVACQALWTKLSSDACRSCLQDDAQQTFNFQACYTAQGAGSSSKQPPSPSRSPPLPPPPAVPQNSLQAKLSLPIDIATISANQSLMVQFKAGLKADISELLTVESDRVVIINITAGSTVVVFAVSPDTQTGASFSPIALVSALNRSIVPLPNLAALSILGSGVINGVGALADIRAPPAGYCDACAFGVANACQQLGVCTEMACRARTFVWRDGYCDGAVWGQPRVDMGVNERDCASYGLTWQNHNAAPLCVSKSSSAAQQARDDDDDDDDEEDEDGDKRNCDDIDPRGYHGVVLLEQAAIDGFLSELPCKMAEWAIYHPVQRSDCTFDIYGTTFACGVDISRMGLCSRSTHDDHSGILRWLVGGPWKQDHRGWLGLGNQLGSDPVQTCGVDICSSILELDQISLFHLDCQFELGSWLPGYDVTLQQLCPEACGLKFKTVSDCSANATSTSGNCQPCGYVADGSICLSTPQLCRPHSGHSCTVTWRTSAQQQAAGANMSDVVATGKLLQSKLSSLVEHWIGDGEYANTSCVDRDSQLPGGMNCATVARACACHIVVGATENCCRSCPAGSNPLNPRCSCLDDSVWVKSNFELSHSVSSCAMAAERGWCSANTSNAAVAVASVQRHCCHTCRTKIQTTQMCPIDESESDLETKLKSDLGIGAVNTIVSAFGITAGLRCPSFLVDDMCGSNLESIYNSESGCFGLRTSVMYHFCPTETHGCINSSGCIDEIHARIPAKDCFSRTDADDDDDDDDDDDSGGGGGGDDDDGDDKSDNSNNDNEGAIGFPNQAVQGGKGGGRRQLGADPWCVDHPGDFLAQPVMWPTSTQSSQRGCALIGELWKMPSESDIGVEMPGYCDIRRASAATLLRLRLRPGMVASIDACENWHICSERECTAASTYLPGIEWVSGFCGKFQPPPRNV
jgi:hypothetical protein